MNMIHVNAILIAGVVNITVVTIDSAVIRCIIPVSLLSFLMSVTNSYCSSSDVSDTGTKLCV